MMCTAAYPEVSAKLAMKIGDLSTIEDLKRPPWTGFAADTSLGAPFVRRRVAELAEMVRAQAPETSASLEAAFNAQELQRFRDIVLERAAAVAASA
jgi:serine/threonine-protein kinase HipA